MSLRPTLSDWQLFYFKDCKWKMYMELDGDEVAITYIKDVIFNANRQDVEILRMTKVPSETHFCNTPNCFQCFDRCILT